MNMLSGNTAPLRFTTSSIHGLAFGLALLFCAPAQGQQHRATRLGSPATRFALPLATPEDLRARFQDGKLRPDIASILHQWGWMGNLEDLCGAARTNEISEVTIPIGARMPFMSSRENGQPICLRDVLWAGKEPIKAYAFNCVSNGRRYRCVTPKACSNFYLEDLGPYIKRAPALEIVCAAPAQVLAGRPVEVCLTLFNTGNAPEPKAFITLPIPPGATVRSATEDGVSSPEQITWEVPDLAPNASKQVRAFLVMRQPGLLSFTPAVRGTIARPAQTDCETRIMGVPAILVEVVDLEDPIEVGQQVTYVITVTNQGDSAVTNIRLLCTLPASQEFVSGTGVTAVRAQDRTITMEPLSTLAGKAVASWQVVTKALQADDSRIHVDFRSDEFEKPIPREESTQLY